MKCNAQLVVNAQKVGDADDRNTSATNTTSRALALTPASNNMLKSCTTVTGSVSLQLIAVLQLSVADDEAGKMEGLTDHFSAFLIRFNA